MRTGDLVDQIDMCYEDGSVARHGNNRSGMRPNEACKLCGRALRETHWHARTTVDGGAAQHPLSLARGEALVAVEVFQAASLFGCQFFLDSGRASPFYGRAVGDCTRFEAAAGVFVLVFLVAKGGRACRQVEGGRSGRAGREDGRR